MHETKLGDQWWTNLVEAARASGVSKFVIDQFVLKNPRVAEVIMDDTDTPGSEDAR
ncbi:hypothetical protein SAMN04489725_11013 [Alicyclobacillus hesperidum]|uniref:Uncharacterized protein n=1 Tax=Alicyclobacillus hesperidum TaxID=89784 RepID=A0A1H2V7K8_9BACL|nr:hypothetical protein [Alicyclobacillus hesperidum]SDW63879.1 hypothetical protein SAMN04489725_11013 [Alicyclobacillus hesperidum]